MSCHYSTQGKLTCPSKINENFIQFAKVCQTNYTQVSPSSDKCCPNNGIYSKSDNKCLSCPANTTYFNNKCLSCPANYSLSSDKGRCELNGDLQYTDNLAESVRSSRDRPSSGCASSEANYNNRCYRVCGYSDNMSSNDPCHPDKWKSNNAQDCPYVYTKGKSIDYKTLNDICYKCPSNYNFIDNKQKCQYAGQWNTDLLSTDPITTDTITTDIKSTSSVYSDPRSKIAGAG